MEAPDRHGGLGGPPTRQAGVQTRRAKPRLSSFGAQELGVGSHLIAPILTNELGGHVGREHVLQEQPSQVLHRLRLFLLLPQLLLPQKVQAAVIFILWRVTGGQGETQYRASSF